MNYLCGMLHLGQYQTLEILRLTPPGLFLGDGEGNEVLLPNKYIPAAYQIGDKIEVFVYLDFDERPVATTLHPKITLNRFAVLKVKDSSRVGAFLDWGLEKDLFVPFREQLSKMHVGAYYPVYMYLDEATGRLAASQKVRKFLDNSRLDLEEGQEVDIIVLNDSDLGVNVVVNQKYAGLIYHDELFSPIRSGDCLKAYVRKIREHNKLDISLQPAGYAGIEPMSAKILDALKAHGGTLPLHDGSDPQEIYNELGISKKAFKKAVGLLYRQKIIALLPDGIQLLKH